jgi:hypothetical protein
MKLVEYVKLRVADGAFRNLDSVLVARAFIGMLYSFVTAEYLFNGEKYFPKTVTDQVVNNFLTIFLDGVRNSKRPD